MSSTVIKISPGDVNLALMHEQIASLLAIPVGVLMAGLTAIDNEGRYEKNLTTIEIGRTKDASGVTIDTADPGELRFTTENPLDGSQLSALDTIVDFHVPTNNTQEQDRRITDVTTKATTVANLKSPTWDALSDGDKMTTLRRACQLLFRTHRHRDFDTDS